MSSTPRAWSSGASRPRSRASSAASTSRSSPRTWTGDGSSSSTVQDPRHPPEGEQEGYFRNGHMGHEGFTPFAASREALACDLEAVYGILPRRTGPTVLRGISRLSGSRAPHPRSSEALTSQIEARRLPDTQITTLGTGQGSGLPCVLKPGSGKWDYGGTLGDTSRAARVTADQQPFTRTTGFHTFKRRRRRRTDGQAGALPPVRRSGESTRPSPQVRDLASHARCRPVERQSRPSEARRFPFREIVRWEWEWVLLKRFTPNSPLPTHASEFLL